jgi:hypothetical protein
MQHGLEKDDFGRISGICWFVRGPVAVMLKDANGRFPAANWIGRFELGLLGAERSIQVNGDKGAQSSKPDEGQKTSSALSETQKPTPD